MSQRDIVVQDEVSESGRRRTMKEQDWLTCTLPGAMMGFLMKTQEAGEGAVPIGPDALISDRKLRLVACACVRRIWPKLSQAARDAIITAERYADGLVNGEWLAMAHEQACQEVNAHGPLYTGPEWAATYISSSTAAYWRDNCVRAMAMVCGHDERYTGGEQADLVREIVGNPWHAWTDPRLAMPRHHLPPGQCSHVGWLDLRWLTNDVMGLAHDALHNQRFDLLPVLADALDDAYFPFIIVQDHLRSHLSHVRGCWALDLIMAKQ